MNCLKFFTICLVALPSWSMIDDKDDMTNHYAPSSSDLSNNEDEKMMSFEKLWTESLSPHIKNDTNRYFFEHALKIFYNKYDFQQDSSSARRFPEAIHAVSTINEGWTCLITKVIKAKSSTQTDSDQLNALLDLLALHKSTLLKVDSMLFGFAEKHAPCEKCVKNAKKRALPNN